MEGFYGRSKRTDPGIPVIEGLSQMHKETNLLIRLSFSKRESESMVLAWRPGLHHCGLGHGGAHDPGSGLPLFRPGAAEVRSVDAVSLHGELLGHHISMVFLGLLARLFRAGHKRVYWRSEAFWLNVYAGGPESRKSFDS